MTIQSEIARAGSRELKTVLSPEEIIQIDKKPTANPEAYNYYLKGNDYYLRSLKSRILKLRLKCIAKAIELDPNFALAYVKTCTVLLTIALVLL